jgi:hypothetical protein
MINYSFLKTVIHLPEILRDPQGEDGGGERRGGAILGESEAGPGSGG